MSSSQTQFPPPLSSAASPSVPWAVWRRVGWAQAGLGPGQNPRDSKRAAQDFSAEPRLSHRGRDTASPFCFISGVIIGSLRLEERLLGLGDPEWTQT